MASFNSYLTIAALSFFLFTFYSVIAINEHDTNVVYDGQPPEYSSIYPDLANLEQNIRNYQIPAEISATIPAHSQSPYSSQSLSKMEIDIWDMLSKNLGIPENYNSVPWGNLVSEITNKAVQKIILVKLAEHSMVGNDFKFNKDIQKMMQTQWSFDSAIHAFKENNNYEMLELCLHLGWRFDNADLKFVIDLFRNTLAAQKVIEKMLQVKNIIEGTKDIFVAFYLGYTRPEVFYNQTVLEFMMTLLSPEQKLLFFKKYLLHLGQGMDVDTVVDQLSPEQRSSDIVPFAIHRECYILATKLIEKGWPLDKVTNSDLRKIRESGVAGLRNAFPGKQTDGSRVIEWL